ncbi:MAG: hypothetical protein HONBIEJF_01590 [Fimbriimonadaceae bacterium]|nr:hypothetical protein [Fimbriimonadaceae bacterium]
MPFVARRRDLANASVDTELHLGASLAALYLDGLRRADCGDLSRQRWPRVADALRRRLPSGATPASILRDSGFWEEALCLDDIQLVARALTLVKSGAALTAAGRAYPLRWTGLSTAPPAIWSSGPVRPATWIGIVGTRTPSPALARAARGLATAASALGFGVVSGGAIGIDRIALSSAARMGGPTLAILPRGLDGSPRSRGVVNVSACSHSAEFDTQRAMQRNAWIFAAAEITMVLGPRFRQGGTWHGAVAALRSGRSAVAVLDLADDATRALINLGATGFALDRPAEDVLADLLAQASTRCLFSAVGEARVAFLS